MVLNTKDRLNIFVLGATSDIARSTMEQFSNKNHSNFFLVARNEDKLKVTVDNLKKNGANNIKIFVSNLDSVTIKQNYSSMFQSCLDFFDHIDIVFVAHGINCRTDESEKNSELCTEVLDINFVGTMYFINEISKYFRQIKSGNIAVISSVAGDRGRVSNYVYGASKSGLSTYLEGLRVSLEPYGVSVITIKPGIIYTSMTKNMKKTILTSTPDRIAPLIYKAILSNKKEIYVPRFWKYIMLVIIHIPYFIFKRIKI